MGYAYVKACDFEGQNGRERGNEYVVVACIVMVCRVMAYVVMAEMAESGETRQ